jgi:hypothetical protein
MLLLVELEHGTFCGFSGFRVIDCGGVFGGIEK